MEEEKCPCEECGIDDCSGTCPALRAYEYGYSNVKYPDEHPALWDL